jgi:hypothetical protein
MEARDKAVEVARERVGRGLPAEEPIPANGYVVQHEGPFPVPPLEAALPPAEAPATPPADTLGPDTAR